MSCLNLEGENEPSHNLKFDARLRSHDFGASAGGSLIRLNFMTPPPKINVSSKHSACLAGFEVNKSVELTFVGCSRTTCRTLANSQATKPPDKAERLTRSASCHLSSLHIFPTAFACCTKSRLQLHFCGFVLVARNFVAKHAHNQDTYFAQAPSLARRHGHVRSA